MAQEKTLAIAGGPRAVPEGAIKPWPPIDDVDRRMVLSSLEGDKHAWGPNCEAFQEEFAAWNGNKYAITTSSGTAAAMALSVLPDALRVATPFASGA